ncbi:MAG: hypothetical protein ABEK29_07960, partial [Bradymonadaceae bacterium]
MSDDSPRNPQMQLSNSNAEFIEEMYEKYRQDPSSVDPSWKPVFEQYFKDGEQPLDGRVPSFRRRSIFEPVQVRGEAPAAETGEADLPTGEIAGATIRPVEKPAGFAARVEALVQAYRLHGHLVADIDPLGRPRPRDRDRRGLDVQ